MFAICSGAALCRMSALQGRVQVDTIPRGGGENGMFALDAVEIVLHEGTANRLWARGRPTATACSRSRTVHLTEMKDDALSSSAPEVAVPDAWPPRVIAFDGDDTLWHNESLFSMTQGRFRMLLMHHADLPSTLIDARLAETVQRNLSVYGHGIKGFVLSMVETAITVTDGRIPAQDIYTILSFGRTMLEYPVELAEGAREVLETLRARDHELWLIADGDVFDQESKLARSGSCSPVPPHRDRDREE